MNYQNYKQAENVPQEVKDRLEVLRAAINSESISYGELAELQGYVEQRFVDEGDIDLLQWGGLPEYGGEEIDLIVHVDLDPIFENYHEAFELFTELLEQAVNAARNTEYEILTNFGYKVEGATDTGELVVRVVGTMEES